MKTFSHFLLITSFLTIVTFSCNSQNTASVEGTWKCIKKETKDGNDGSNLTFTGQPYTCRVNITLLAQGNGIENNANEKFKYSLKDSILTLGNRQYIIEKLNKTTLVILEKPANKATTLSIGQMRMYLEKQ